MIYKDVETHHDQDGMIAVITQRLDPAKGGKCYFSFKLQKEFVNNGEIKHTHYYGRAHIDAIIRLSKKVGERIDILDEQFKLSQVRDRAARSF